MEEKLSWKEKFSASILIAIGIVFLAAQIASIISSRSNNYSVQNGSLQINRSDLLADIRSYVIMALSLMGGYLLFKKKRLGWVIGMAVIFLFLLLASWGMIQAFNIKVFDIGFALITAGAIILLLSLIFLVIPAARKKYRVGKSAVLPTLVFLILLSALLWFLQ